MTLALIVEVEVFYGKSVCAIELATNDLPRAKSFFKSLFDWRLEEIPGMDYTMIEVGEGTGGGMMKNPVPGIPSHWLAFVLVDDVVAMTKKAKSLGASIAKDITEVPDTGLFSVILDPTGAAIGLWQPKGNK